MQDAALKHLVDVNQSINVQDTSVGVVSQSTAAASSATKQKVSTKFKSLN